MQSHYIIPEISTFTKMSTTTTLHSHYSPDYHDILRTTSLQSHDKTTSIYIPTQYHNNLHTISCNHIIFSLQVHYSFPAKQLKYTTPTTIPIQHPYNQQLPYSLTTTISHSHYIHNYNYSPTTTPLQCHCNTTTIYSLTNITHIASIRSVIPI